MFQQKNINRPTLNNTIHQLKLKSINQLKHYPFEKKRNNQKSLPTTAFHTHFDEKPTMCVF